MLDFLYGICDSHSINVSSSSLVRFLSRSAQPALHSLIMAIHGINGTKIKIHF